MAISFSAWNRFPSPTLTPKFILLLILQFYAQTLIPQESSPDPPGWIEPHMAPSRSAPLTLTMICNKSLQDQLFNVSVSMQFQVWQYLWSVHLHRFKAQHLAALCEQL